MSFARILGAALVLLCFAACSRNDAVTAGEAGGIGKEGAVPDFSGVWVIQPQYRMGGGSPLEPAPQLTEATAAAKQRMAAAGAKGYTRQVANMLCQHVGGPSLFQSASPFNIFSGFGRIVFVFETEWNNQPRTVYLNQSKHEENLLPSYNGESIGHWEGNVLVVDTIGFNGRHSHRGNWLGGVPRSEQAHLIERFSISDDGKVLTDEITTIDPVTLREPWTVTLKFDRMPDTEKRIQIECETDLDAFNSLDLQALKNADPEIARLLDPELRASDPALKYSTPGDKQ